MSVQTSPGVNVQEFDLSLYTPAQGTTSLGIVGTATRGDFNVPTLITDEGSLVANFGEPDDDDYGLLAAIRFLRRSKSLWFLRVGNTAAMASPATVTAKAAIAGVFAGSNGVFARSPGTWGNSITIKIEASEFYSYRYTITILFKDQVVETFDNLEISHTDTSDSGYWLTVLQDQSNYVTAVGSSYATPATSSTALAFAGGADGKSGITAGNFIGAAGSPPATSATGLQAFRDPEGIGINLLAVPGAAEYSSGATIIAEEVDIAASRRDVVAIIDTPKGMSVAEAVDWHNGIGGGPNLNSSYAACYYGWLEVYDPYSETNLFIPPSGHVAGVYAKTDFETFPWYPPAGMVRGLLSDVVSMEHSPTEGEREYMYNASNAINPIVNFPGQGIVVWGQRTTQRAATSLDRVNVRRMVMVVEAALRASLRPLIMEPNDATTWSVAQSMCQTYLAGVKASRGLTDYRAICDATTNTAAIVAQNKMIVKVLLKPTKAAEIITLQLVLIPTGANVSDFA